MLILNFHPPKLWQRKYSHVQHTSTTDHICDSGPVRLQWNWKFTITQWQLTHEFIMLYSHCYFRKCFFSKNVCCKTLLCHLIASSCVDIPDSWLHPGVTVLSHWLSERCIQKLWWWTFISSTQNDYCQNQSITSTHADTEEKGMGTHSHWENVN